MNDISKQVRKTTEEADRAAQAGASVVADQAEALQHMWQAGAEMASNLTARSADQVVRAFGVGGNEIEKGAAQVSGNVGALAQSASAWVHGVQAISTDGAFHRSCGGDGALPVTTGLHYRADYPRFGAKDAYAYLASARHILARS
jgi:hypothetical protein